MTSQSLKTTALHCFQLSTIQTSVNRFTKVNRLKTDLQKSIDFLLNPFFVFRNDLYVNLFYYILITDTTLELSVFWPSDTESQINELRFSECISLSFKTRLMSVTCFCGDVV